MALSRHFTSRCGWTLAVAVVGLSLLAVTGAWAQTALYGPYLQAPIPGATISAVRIYFNWVPINGVTAYQLQVGTDSNFDTLAFSTTVTEMGELGQVGDMTAWASAIPGNYFWRVCAFSGSTQGPWSAAWNFTVPATPPVLPAPTLLWPANGETIPLFTYADGLQWSAVSGATSYLCQVSTSTDFSHPVFQGDSMWGSGTGWSSITAGTYYWRVCAVSGTAQGLWSSVWSFTISGSAVAPNPPALIAPANAGKVSGPINFQWTPTATSDGHVAASTWEVQASTSSSFSTLAFDTSVSHSPGTTWASPAPGTYYWRVRTYSGTTPGGWSPVWTVTESSTGVPAPILVSPADSSSALFPFNLQWQPVAGAAAYMYQVGTADFSTVYAEALTTGTTATYTDDLQGGGNYYWRVYAIVGGVQGPWSQAWQVWTPGSNLAAPTLTAPANGSSVSSLPLTVTWNAVPGATKYLVEAAQSPNMISQYSEDGMWATTTSLDLGYLQPGTWYWEVMAWDDNGVGLASAVWSFTVPTPPPSAPNLYAPANGSTLASTSMNLQWSSVTSATSYTVQVSTDKNFGSTAYNPTVTGTSTSWTATAGGTYYWRVCANAGSVAGTWSSVWSFIVPTPLPAPVLTAPGNGSSVTVPINFQWQAVTGATYYDLQVATSTAFNAPLTFEQGTSNTNLSWSGAVPGTYYWRVMGYSGTTPGTWSDPWSFTIPAGAPTLVSPVGGATVTPPISFQWQTVPGASYYQVQASTDPAFGSLAYYHGSTATTQSWSLTAYGVYYWRACAYYGTVQGPWSSPASFSYLPPPLYQVKLTSPTNGSTAAAPTLKWGAVTGAKSYAVEVATDSGFSHVVIKETDTSTSRAWLSAPPGTYYWRVYAIGTGQYGPWSAIWHFTVPGTVLLPPVLTAPSKGATVPNTVTLTWNKAAGATSYYVKVATDAAFSDIELITTTTATQLALGTQTVGTTLYWEVCSQTSSAKSAFSAPWSFTVGATPPLAAPQLVSPTDDATEVSDSPTLEWDAVDGATSYYVQVASDAGFSNKVYVGTTTATSKALTGLAAGGCYYWRVMSLAAGRTGTWSDVWTFGAK